MSYIKVKDKDNLFRDTNSNGIVNCDEESYNNYVQNYKRKLTESQKIESLDVRLNEIKNDIDDIKNLLLKLTLNS